MRRYAPAMRARNLWPAVRRVVRWVVVALLGLIVFVAALVWFNIPRSFPQVDGQMRFAGLDGEVEIIRDVDGVPHIYADTVHDLLFAQGLVEAQDRFWQMDFFRHVGHGELAEMFGGSQVETDRFLRTLGWGEIADRERRNLDPTVAEYLQYYADGVNAYTGDRRGGELSFEHFILRFIARSYTPDRWTPTDTLVFGKVMAWDLAGNLGAEIDRSILAADLPVARVEELYPPYPIGAPVIVPSELLEGARPALASTGAALPQLTELRASLQRLDDLIGTRDPSVGSNNWAVAGSLTSTGMPLLANDPHLGISMPSIWYEVGLHCTTVTPECPFDVVGFSFPGVPGVVIGHNADIAWGVTNLNPDEMDLYIEKVNPDNPNQYEFEGGWREMDVRSETIVVAGGGSEQVVVRSTVHGPVISEVYGPLEDVEPGGLELPERYVISMRWTGLQESTLSEALLGINQASNWTEFREAASKWDIAGQNLVYADTDGNIGYQATGRIPVRANHDGRWPVPGWTGEWEWTGWIPFEDMPSTFNPARGYVASANQPLVDEAYPYHVHDDVAYGYRASRIEAMILGAEGPLDAAFMRRMQSDARNAAAEIAVPYLIDLDDDSEAVELAKEVFGAWSFGADDPLSNAYQMVGDTPGAALFGSFWRHLLELTFHDELPEDTWPNGGGRWFQVVEGLLEQPASPWWDDIGTDDVVEDRDAILVEALRRAVEELGDNPDRWDWTEMHTAKFVNASLGRSGIPPIEWILNSGNHGVAGGGAILNATAWDAAEGTYDVVVLPSMRMVVDLSNLSASTAIHTTGQSGHPNHEHYDDMIERWVVNDPHPMRWTRSDVENGERSTLILFPIDR